MWETFSVWDTVYYSAYVWAIKERWIVSSLSDDKNFIFVRFKSVNWERCNINNLTK